MNDACAQNDLAGRNIRWVVWGLPATLLVLGGFLGPMPRVLLWTPALLVAGAACVINAGRCHRVHCSITGPLYLIAAAATIVRGLDIVAWPWHWMAVWIVGGTVLAYIPEYVWGKYGVRTGSGGTTAEALNPPHPAP